MIPRVPQTNGGVGKSFTGTAAYLLHDEKHAKTNERVLWTETHNLATDDPEFAARVMAATAMSARDIQKRYHENEQDKLEAESDDPDFQRENFRGAKRGFNHVWHFSLSWSGEKEGHTLTRDEMIRAAHEALRHLKADHLQALIVAHESETNPHCHVMVNRVNPETGRTETPESNAKRKLSAWALEYEKERGHVLVPAREQNADLRARGIRYSQNEISTQDHRARQTAVNAIAQDPKAAKQFAAQQRLLDKELSDASKAMARRQKFQLDSLFSGHNRRKAEINRFSDQNISQSKASIDQTWAPRIKHQRSEHKDEEDAFIEREASLYGRAVNIAETLKSIKETGLEAQRGKLGQMADALFNSAGRLQQMQKRQDKQKAELDAQRVAEITEAKTLIERERKNAIHENYERFVASKDEVALKHETEKAEDKLSWLQRGLDRVHSWKEYAASHGLKKDFENNQPRNEALEAQRGVAQGQFEKAGANDTGRQDEEETDEGISESAQVKADAFKEGLKQSVGRGTPDSDVSAARERYQAAKEQNNTPTRDRGQDE